MLQVLVDADNVAPGRLQPVLDVLTAIGAPAAITASGRQDALDRIDWPEQAEILAHAPGDGPLVLISGDGDFALLAARHPGPVLVISGAASMRLRDSENTTVLDPATDGLAPIRAWLSGVGYAAPS
jgi:hypothetical protein